MIFMYQYILNMNIIDEFKSEQILVFIILLIKNYFA